MSIGIDYSMSCPAACSYEPTRFGAYVQFWYAHATKHDVSFPQVTAIELPEFFSVSKRAAFLASELLDWIGDRQTLQVWIEDYAFNATGRVFHIGENTGILKHYLDLRDITYTPVPPTVVKKFATSKGNADKYKMVDAFLKDYPPARDWITKFFPRYKPGAILAKSPLSDLADAYFIAKYANSTSKA